MGHDAAYFIVEFIRQQYGKKDIRRDPQYGDADINMVFRNLSPRSLMGEKICLLEQHVLCVYRTKLLI